jgi:hypothetical protein
MFTRDQRFSDDPVYFAQAVFNQWASDASNHSIAIFLGEEVRSFFSDMGKRSDEYYQLFFGELKKQFVEWLLASGKVDLDKQVKKFIKFLNYVPDQYHELFDDSSRFHLTYNQFFIDVLKQLSVKDLSRFLPVAYEESSKFTKASDIDQVFEILKQLPGNFLQYIAENPYVIRTFSRKFSQLFLMQDEDGNSLLFYLSRKSENDVGYHIKNVLLNIPDAKCIRADKEVKNPLMLMVAALEDNEEIDEQFLQNNLQYLNSPDDTERTALHYAVILKKTAALKQLLKQKNIDFAIQDKSGRNALHYLILGDDQDLANEIFDQLSTNPTHQENFAKALNQNDKNGLSSLTMACFLFVTHKLWNADDPKLEEFMVNKIIKHPDYLAQKNQFDQLFYKICDDLGCVDQDGRILPEYFEISNQQQETEEWLRGIYKTPDIDDYVKKYLFCAFANLDHPAWDVYDYTKLSTDTKTQFTPFGVELELVNFHIASPIPIHLIDRLYNSYGKGDASVEDSMLMYSGSVQEVVSDPIKNEEEFRLFLKMCEDFQTSGVMTNQSTGLHVHINFNSQEYGALVDKVSEKFGSELDLLCKEKVELLLLKQIVINFASLQQLLQGFMRNGALFNDEISHSKLILNSQDKIDKFLKTEWLVDLFKDDSQFDKRSITLNLKNLNGSQNAKGTLEFRCHEGSIDPTIIKAWVNFIHRLVNMSVDHLVDHLKNSTGSIEEKIESFEIKPLKNIEYLIYLLIADRRYQETWDANLGIVPSHYDFAANKIGGEIIQKEIQKSPFYRSIQMRKILPEVKDPQDIEQLERIIEILKKYPDIIDCEDSPTNSPSVDGATKEEILQLTQKASLPKHLPDF